MILLAPTMCLALLGAAPAAHFHRDARFGAFEVALEIPDFQPAYERVFALSPDGRTFLLAAQWEVPEPGGHRGGRPVPPRIFGRFDAGGDAKVDVFVAPAQGPGAPRKVTTLSLALPSKPVHAPEVLAGWADAENAELAAAARGLVSEGADGYAIWRSAALYGAAAESDARSARRRGHTTNVYEVMTGYAAARETLQVDAMRGQDHAPGASVDIHSLDGPALPTHPFEKMRAGRVARVFDEARAIPAGDWVLHVRSPDAAFQLIDLLDAWGTDLASAVEGRAVDHGARERLFAQLALPRGELARAYAKQAVETLSLAGNDPFFREGTDLTLVFAAKDAPGLAQALELTRASKAANARREAYQGTSLSILESPDRSISSVLATSGRFVFLGNSAAGVRACLDALAGRVPSLASAPDFLYVRSLSATEEDAFLYLSDAFVRAVTGPGMKIADQRREACEHHLREIAWGRLLAQRDRRGALTLQQLVKEGYVPDDLTCPHGGRYTLDQTGPRCSVHGRPAFLTPLAELPVDVVTSAEADSYREFVTGYRTYWRQFLDPIAVRMKLGPPLQFDTQILPLVDNTIYSALRGGLAQKTSGLDLQGESDKTLVALSAALDPTPEMRHFVDHFMRDTGLVGGDPWKWIGNRASLVLYDGDPIFTVDATKLPLFERGRSSPVEMLGLTALFSALTLPSALVVQVKDPALARQGIERLGAALSKDFAHESGGLMTGVASYRLEDPKGGDAIGVLSLQLMGVQFRFYYTVLGDQLYLATRRWLVEDLIRRGTAFPKGGADPQPGHYRLRIEHAHLQQARAALQANWGEAMRDACFKNLPELELLHQAGSDASRAAGPLGFTPYCPAGGRYLADPEGHVACSLHGTPHASRLPGALADETSTARWLDQFSEIDLTLTLDPEGLTSRAVLSPRR